MLTKKKLLSMPVILLVDNGSVRADAVLGLRAMAKKLSVQTSRTIYPVSLRHADSISRDELGDVPAYTFRAFLQSKIEEGEKHFIILPLFFGESKAVTVFMPSQIDALKEQFSDLDLDVKIADVLFSELSDNTLLADILTDHVLNSIKSHHLEYRNIVLVDHGSPSQKVTAVRNALANQISEKLEGSIQDNIEGSNSIDQAVMERREGKEYDFNGELLKSYLLKKAKAGDTQAVVILQFLLAGRHAGRGGDIVTICESVMEKYPKL